MEVKKKKTRKEKRRTASLDNLRQILKEIEPFVNKPRMKEYSTAGQWFDTSDVTNFSK